MKRNEVFDALVSACACDLNADGYDEILAICNQALYWEHRLVSLGEEYRDSNPSSDLVISVFIPGWKSTAFKDIVVKSMGATPTLNDAHRDYMPSWSLRSSGENSK